MLKLPDTYASASELAVAGRYGEAADLYEQIVADAECGELRAQALNDLAVIAAVTGDEAAAHSQFQSVVGSNPDYRIAADNLRLLLSNNDDSPGSVACSNDHDRIRIAVVSLLFNWPSTGGGTVHTKELCDFLTRDGYDVRHFIARNRRFGVGRVGEALPYESSVLEFDGSEWRANQIRDRFREAVGQYAPDYVIVTDSWNTKPLLCEAVSEFPYFIRIAALETICPLNNVRLLADEFGQPRQCPCNQLRSPSQCRMCLSENARFSGGLHAAERELAGFGLEDYPERLRRAFAEAAGVLVVNPSIADLVRPHASAVHVVPSGFDAGRFPADVQRPRHTVGGKVRILFAGLVEELMKGYRVLRQAGERLWRERQDFEIVATADPPGQAPEWLRFVGWQTQGDLPRVISDADILAFPTLAQEALGRTAVEAMACGRPVVASNIGGLSWVVEDGVTGLLFEPADVAGLCRQLDRLLDDGELRTRLGRAGRVKFEREFTWEVILERHYRPLLGLPARTQCATSSAVVGGRD